MLKMDLFDDSTCKSHELPNVISEPTNQDLLDYMVLVLARYLGSSCAFKGGYMMNQLLREESRMTRDIDFSIMSQEVYLEIKTLLMQIAEKFKEMKLISEYRVKEEITVTSSGGIDMYDSMGAKVLGVDVGLHDILYGVQSYTISVGDVRAFKVERMLADKILTILSEKRFRRTKDLYDFYILVTRFDFSYEELVYCIEHRNGYNAAVWDNIPFDELVLQKYLQAWNKLQLISSLTGVMLHKPEFYSVIALFTSLTLRLKMKQQAESWDHCTLVWRD